METNSGASIVAIVRDGTVHANPGPGVRLEPEDLVGVLGTADQRQSFLALV